MRILYNSKTEKYKTPFGCLKRDEKCILRIDIPKNCETQNVSLYIFDEKGFSMTVPFNKEMDSCDYEIYKTSFSLFKEGLYFYYFKIATLNSEFSLYKKKDETNIEEGDLWQVTCYDRSFDTPADFKGKIMYQIFPDRFAISGNCDLKDKIMPYTVHKNKNDMPEFEANSEGKILNNDFFGGNLKGIEEKLPYIKKLGVGIIYLNPIFMAFSNHRYDTADYKRIDPMLGTDEDFISLCKSAHELDIKIILDGVFSHTGSISKYFDKTGIFGNGAYKNENSPYRDWYSFEEYPDKYTSWWGIDTLPCTNELNKSFMDFIIYDNDSVIAHWLKMGADGYRLDVVDEIPDIFVYELKKRMKEVKPDSLLIGEVWEDASNKISYGERRTYFTKNELDSVMNYPFRKSIIDFISGTASAEQFKDEIMTIVENYPKCVCDCLMNMLSTHDTQRILTVFDENRELETKKQRAEFKMDETSFNKAMNRLRAASVLQFTLPGIPCIYYGDEIGTQGYEDPMNRTFFDWSKQGNDNCKFFEMLGKIKNTYKPLQMGDINFVSAHGRELVFERGYEKTKVVVSIGSPYKKEGSKKLLEFEFEGLTVGVFEESMNKKADFKNVFAKP